VTTIEMHTSPMPLDICLVSVRGEELDLHNVAQFKERMARILEEEAKIVLDMSEVAFIDSSGFGAILSCLRSLNRRGGDLRICRLQKGVRMLLEQVRLHRIVGIHDTPEQAMAAFAATAIVAPLFTPSQPRWLHP
jgi:anti-sigma B factor antagonist